MTFILDRLPTPEEFFRDYWNKKPFVVRGMVPAGVIDGLIDEDHIAGLAMEEEVTSRLVRKGENQAEWTCEHGPFEEEVFADLGEEDWSLLVQNIDQYHAETAELLKYFNLSPRWLLDDIMASFSPKGGTVGAHIDSYHVFLVQGKGERRWKVANRPIVHEDYIQDIPLKILSAPFEGEEVTTRSGDVIYIPPKFAHEGISLKPSLTYSVGFLGPSLPEMLIEFGHYIENCHPEVPRYLGKSLTETAVPFQLPLDHVDDLRSFMTEVFDQEHFTKWLSHYFTSPTHVLDYEDEGAFNELDEDYSVEDIIAGSAELIKPPFIKMMIIPLAGTQRYCVSAQGLSFELDFADLNLANAMAQEVPFSADLFKNHREILENLLKHNIVSFAD